MSIPRLKDITVFCPDTDDNMGMAALAGRAADAKAISNCFKDGLEYFSAMQAHIEREYFVGSKEVHDQPTRHRFVKI